MEEDEPQIVDFMSITGADADVAKHYLEACNRDMSTAINAYLENTAQSHLHAPTVSSRHALPSSPDPIRRSHRVEAHPLSDSGDIFEDPSGVDDAALGSGEAGENAVGMDEATSPAASLGGDSNDSFHTPTHLSSSPQANAESSFVGAQGSQQRRDLPEDFPEGFDRSDLHEAQMLEAALLGVPFQGDLAQMMPAHEPVAVLPPSPATLAARALREQQDFEYQESERQDREKREAEMAEERQQREAEVVAAQQRQQEADAMSRLLDRKRSSLPEEPAEDDPDALVVLVRLPDGARCQRRFRRTDSVVFLFDFVDVDANRESADREEGAQHWWTLEGYDLMTPFPRRRISNNQELSFEAAGLNNKRETLFVEMK